LRGLFRLGKLSQFRQAFIDGSRTVAIFGGR